MKKRNNFLLAVPFLLLGFCFLVVSKNVDAHRTWEKITKLPNGLYCCESDYYDYKPWLKSSVKLKISKKYFKLNSSVENFDTGRVYFSDPLKLKLSNNCKFYFEPSSGGCRKVSKSKAVKYIKKMNKKGKLYNRLDVFGVKNNKVTKVFLYYY